MPERGEDFAGLQAHNNVLRGTVQVQEGRRAGKRGGGAGTGAPYLENGQGNYD